mmetsp:Transcript_4159/g.9422  ORF Transcript_4159/g.9422 Transcript_4159/m.9422 type:complete len:207 (+) Transcript_4159:815-1435(+)
MMSPIAWIDGTFVWKLWSTRTCPRSLTLTPTSVRPGGVTGRRPMHISTTSASSSSLAPSPTASVPMTTPGPLLVTPVTLVPSLNLIPCFLSTARKFLDTSESMPAPPMKDWNSTTVTSAPRRSHTEPSSSPMTPPPMTTIFLGTDFSERAPVEVTIVSSSTVTPGKGVTSEPVASMILSAIIFCEPPPIRSTDTSFTPDTAAAPLT